MYAGGAGCCAAGKAKSASAGRSSACSKMLSKLNLTSDQQTRIAELNQQLRTATSKSERIAMFAQGMQRILTPEQFAQWKSVSDKMGGQACSLMTTQAGCCKGLIDLGIDRKTPARCAGVLLFGVARHPLALTLAPTFVWAKGGIPLRRLRGEAQVRWSMVSHGLNRPGLFFWVDLCACFV